MTSPRIGSSGQASSTAAAMAAAALPAPTTMTSPLFGGAGRWPARTLAGAARSIAARKPVSRRVRGSIMARKRLSRMRRLVNVSFCHQIGASVICATETYVMNDSTRTELEAAAFRTLVQHLRDHPDVQNIDLMNLAGFCRNCLSKWYKAAAEERGLEMDYDEAREIVYGMPYAEYKAKPQREASPEKQAKFQEQQAKHG